jgi:hypothetical protein
MQSKSTLEWLNAQTNKKTKEGYSTNFPFFLRYMSEQLKHNVTGDELLAMRKADLVSQTYDIENKVLACKMWVAKQPQKTHPEKMYSEIVGVAVSTAVRSFFAYHRVGLVFRRFEGKKLTDYTPLNEKYRFSLEDFRKMYAVADLEEKYVLCFGKSVGLRAEDFVEFTRGDLEPYIQGNVEPPVCIAPENGIMTRKEHVPAYPFIDSDALPVIRATLEQMNAEGRTGDKCRMFTKTKNKLTKALKRLVKRAGIKTGDKVVKFHCLRAFLSDKLSRYMSESKWKQIVGKTISEDAYISADELRKDFMRATPDLAINRLESSSNVAQMAKLEALKAIAQTMGIDVAGVFKMRKAVSQPEQIIALEGCVEAKRKEGTDGFVKAGGLPYDKALARSTAKFIADVVRETKKELRKPNGKN